MTHPRLRELETFLDERRAELRAAVDAVPPALRRRRPAPDCWSTAEVLEHLATLEGAVARLVAGGVEDARASGVAETEVSSVRPRLDADAMRDRSRGIQAPDRLLPRGELDDAAAWAAVERARATLLAALAGGDGLALGAVTRPHPLFGPLDLYQWVLAVGGHEARHAGQIRDIADALGTHAAQR
ncbi:MAG TPA: DinB family protein [Gemmatirosa sp.]